MEKSDSRINFHKLVAEVEENRILLPDFQRKFAWSDAESQTKLVASVLCRMPLGSILLLETPAMDFAARRIGSNQAASALLECEKRDFLLDGQQRVTVMVNAFSDLIHENGVAQIESLKRRFFLGVPKPENLEAEDPFGFRRLCFPLEDPDNEFPDFMTETVMDAIEMKPFRKDDDLAYNPYCVSEKNLLSFCLGCDGYYFIPLYLLVKRKDRVKRDRNLRLLRRILETLAEEQGQWLLDELSASSGKERRKRLEQMIREDQALENAVRDQESLAGEIKNLERDWPVKMERYLNVCMQAMNLHVIGTPNSNRAKAIEIFENINRGGAKLGTFDLVMARAARVDRDFRTKLREECGREGSYPAEYVPDRVRAYYDKYVQRKREERESYQALRELGCTGREDGELSRPLQEAFLNVLALKCHDAGGGGSRRYRAEYSRNSILRLEAGEIAGNYREVCAALDRAAFFLHARCGVRRITDVNYHLMYTVLSYLFLDRAVYESRKNWNLLTAWYWCAVFSGRYDKDQNVQAERDIGYLKEMVYGCAGSEYVRDMYGKAFAMPLFSDKQFLLYRESEESRVYPKEALGKYLCRYFLVDGYPDMYDRDIRICAFPYTEEVEELEQHHIIPLMSSQSVRESERRLSGERGGKSILNSPLNLALITAKANKRIAARNVADYVRDLQSGAVRELGLQLPDRDMREADIEGILSERFTWIRGKLANDMQVWLGPGT